jgi:hypothetical protein
VVELSGSLVIAMSPGSSLGGFSDEEFMHISFPAQFTSVSPPKGISGFATTFAIETLTDNLHPLVTDITYVGSELRLDSHLVPNFGTPKVYHQISLVFQRAP